jgi:predicted DNA-binding transcriptional regulator AlpA
MDAPESALKRTIFIEELSAIIGKTATTIRTCATNAKYHHLIPRPRKMPNSRRLFWYEEDVRAWQAASTPVGTLIRRRRGRPTKTDQVVRARTIEQLE